MLATASPSSSTSPQVTNLTTAITIPPIPPYIPQDDDLEPPTDHLPLDLVDPMESIPCTEEVEIAVSREILKNLPYPEIDFKSSSSAPPSESNLKIVELLKQLIENLELLKDDPKTPLITNAENSRRVTKTRDQYVTSLLNTVDQAERETALKAYQTALESYKPSKEELTFQIKSLKEAFKSIAACTFPITSGKQVSQSNTPQKLPGVGAGTAQRIDEILISGTLQELSRSASPRANAIKSLSTIHGIGPVKALQFLEKYEVNSAEELIARYKSGELKIETNGLTQAMCRYMDHYDDLQKRIPYQEIREINHIMKHLLFAIDPKIKGIICGSHRRLLKTSGDIDLLLVHPDLEDDAQIARSNLFPKIINTLKSMGLLIADLNDSLIDKYFGILKLSPTHLARRIDILFIGRKSFPTALAYFTGSGTFNQMVRQRALELNYTLSEHSLSRYNHATHSKGEAIKIHSERDIFRVLRIKLDTTEPPMREFGKTGRVRVG